MHNQKCAYLIDFDNTLFDTEALKKDVSELIKKRFGVKNLSLFWKIYSNSQKSLQYVDIKKISQLFSAKLKSVSAKEVEEVFTKLKFRKYVFEHSTKLIKTLKMKGRVILYSLGDSDFQPLKIKGSGIENLIGKKNIVILKNKKLALNSLMLTLKTKGYKQIIILDDKVEILEKAKNLDQNTVTIWFKYGKYKSVVPKNELSVDFETESGDDLVYCLTNFVARIQQNNFKENVCVLKGISKPQIERLVYLTARDKLVTKFTHDKDRFKSVKTFAAWKKRRKYIYTMVGKKGGLLGIIWFAQKAAPKTYLENIKNPDFKYTFAIRTYPPVRGKGLSSRFMHVTFKDFQVSKEGGIWLTTSKLNTSANKLYLRYGFKKISDLKDGRTLYTFRG